MNYKDYRKSECWFFMKDCYKINHISIFILLCGLFPHYIWTGLITCLVQENVTKFLGLGIRPEHLLSLSCCPQKPRSLGWLPWAWEALWRRRLKEHEQRGAAISTSPYEVTDMRGKQMMAHPASVNLPAGCKYIGEPSPHHYTTWGKENLSSPDRRIMSKWTVIVGLNHYFLGVVYRQW